MVPPGLLEGRQVVQFRSGALSERLDSIAVERALRVWVLVGRERTQITSTLRTPGADRELVLGFCLAEGLIDHLGDVLDVRLEADSCEVELAPHCEFRVARSVRLVATVAACGTCGRAEPMKLEVPKCAPTRVLLDPRVVMQLGERVRAAQPGYLASGGLHAAALFSVEGTLLASAEDVGRHNAVDKVVGLALQQGFWGGAATVLFVSGRAGFELAQKAARAGLTCLVAVGAASSLAVDVATEAGLTLIGFANKHGFNVYSGAERLLSSGTFGETYPDSHEPSEQRRQ